MGGAAIFIVCAANFSRSVVAKTPAEFVSACGGTYSGENGTTRNVYNFNESMNSRGAFRCNSAKWYKMKNKKLKGRYN